jgi:hypothetical protein
MSEQGAEPLSAELTDADLRGCRFIESEATPLRSGMFCCATPAEPGGSWCAKDRKIVWAGPRQHERVSASSTDLGRTAVPVGARGHGLGCADASMGAAARALQCPCRPRMSPLVSERAFPRNGTPAAEDRFGGSGGSEHCGNWGTREPGPQLSERRAAERTGAARTTRLRVGGLNLLS